MEGVSCNDGKFDVPNGIATPCISSSVKSVIEKPKETKLSDTLLGESDGFGVNRMGNLIAYTCGGGVLGYFIAESYGKSKLGGVVMGIGSVLAFFYLLVEKEKGNVVISNKIAVPTPSTTITEDAETIVDNIKDFVAYSIPSNPIKINNEIL